MVQYTARKLKLVFIPCEENNYRPKSLDGNFLVYCLLFLIILKLIFIPFLIYLPKTVFFADLTKTALVYLTNEERHSLRIQTLNVNPVLEKAAYDKAKDILENDYFSHKSPQGKTPWYWFGKAGYDYKSAGENLAIGFLDAEEVFKEWNESPGHRENILNPQYQDMGIAVMKGDFKGKEVTVVVQLFGSKQPKEESKNAQEIALSKENPNPKEFPLLKERERGKEQFPEENEELEEELAEKNMMSGAGEKSDSKEIAGSSEDNKPEINEASQPEKAKTEIRFLGFMSTGYLELVKKIIYSVLILAIVILALTIFIKLNIQHPDLILRAIIIIFLLTLFVLVDKQTIINLIPHQLIIF